MFGLRNPYVSVKIIEDLRELLSGQVIAAGNDSTRNKTEKFKIYREI